MSDPGLVINVSYSNDGEQTRAPGRLQRKRKQRRVRNKMEKVHMDFKHKHMKLGGRFRPCELPRLNGASARRLSPPTSRHCNPKPPTHSQPSSAAAGNTGSGHSSSVSSSQTPAATRPTAGIPTKYLAMDCEMVGTGPKGSVSQLARCSIVSYEGDVVYDKFIKPTVPVTDYRSRWSGIRPRDLANATPYIEARKEILRLLSGKVVVGHAVHNDFKVLSYSHPSSLTRDTSRVPLLNLKAGFAEHECASLKRLTKAIFNRDIQTGKKGHSSVEDARATMELYKVVEEEWERKLASASKTS